MNFPPPLWETIPQNPKETQVQDFSQEVFLHAHNLLCLKKKTNSLDVLPSSEVNDLLPFPKSPQNFRQINAGAFDLLPRCFDHRRATYVHAFLDILGFFISSKVLTAFSLRALWALQGVPAQSPLPRQGLVEGAWPGEGSRKLLWASLDAAWLQSLRPLWPLREHKPLPGKDLWVT